MEGNIVSKLKALLLPLKDSQSETRSKALKSSSSFYDLENFNLWKKIYFPCVDEKNPVSVGALNFPFHIIQDVVLRKCVPSELKSDSTYTTLKNNILSQENKYVKTYRKMTRKLEISQYDSFESVANDLCGFTYCSFEVAEERMTWSTIISIFTFAVFLAYKYRLDADRVEEVSRYLSKYIMKYPLPFIRSNGGWGSIVKQCPAKEPLNSDWIFNLDSEDSRKELSISTMVLWSGLCVGSVASTMFFLTRKH